MRTKVFAPAVALLLAGAAPAAKCKTIPLTGSWKETNRYREGKTPVSFNDTVRIDFLIGNEYVWQKDMGYTYRGTYKQTETVLDMGARYFTILEMKPGRMLVKSDEGTFEFSRYTKPAPPVDANHPIPRANNEVATGGKVEPAQLVGKWDRFKGTNSVTQEKIDYTRMLKTVDISMNGGKIQGAVYAAQRTPETGIWTIEKYENGTLYCSGTDRRELKVLQCANGELVIQEGTMTYFFKIFN